MHVDGFHGNGTPSPEGYVGGFLFVDDKSRVMDVRGYRRKSEFLTILQSYVANIRRQSVRVTGLHVHVKSDYAKEMTSTTVKAWCAANNVTMSHSAPHEPQENSVAERHVGIIKSVARTIHLHAGFPPNFWFFSGKLAAHVLMFVPPAIFRSVGVSVTPYEVMYGNTPSLLHLHSWLPCVILQLQLHRKQEEHHR